MYSRVIPNKTRGLKSWARPSRPSVRKAQKDDTPSRDQAKIKLGKAVSCYQVSLERKESGQGSAMQASKCEKKSQEKAALCEGASLEK